MDLPQTRHTVSIVGYKEARIEDQPLKIKNLRDPRPDEGCSERSQRLFLILRPALLGPAKFKSRRGVSVPESEGRFLISETGQIDPQWGGWTFSGAILLLGAAPLPAAEPPRPLQLGVPPCGNPKDTNRPAQNSRQISPCHCAKYSARGSTESGGAAAVGARSVG